MQLPEDVARLRSEAYGHKMKRAYHGRKLAETVALLSARCEELGIPVPSLPNAQSPITKPRRQGDHENPRSNSRTSRAA